MNAKARLPLGALVAVASCPLFLVVFTACEKKDAEVDAGAPVAVTPVVVAPVAVAPEAAAPVALAAVTPVPVAKGQPRVGKLADGGVVLLAADGGVLDATVPPSLAAQANAVAAQVGLVIPSAMPTAIVIPSAITLPTALPSGFPTLPGFPTVDSGKK